MFQHLEPGRRNRNHLATPRTLAVSGTLHLGAIAFAIHYSVSPLPPPQGLTAEDYTMLSVISAALFPPNEDAGGGTGGVSADVSEVIEVSADDVAGEAPFEIPPIEASLAMYGGLPEGPGRGPGGSSPPTGDGLVLDSIVLMQQPVFRFAYDGLEPIEPPSIRNRQAMSELLADRYPSRLRFAGVSGMVTLRFVIDERGRVEPGSVRLLAADREEFALVALRLIGRFQFFPARYRGEAVPMVIELPISWRSARE